MYSSLVSIAAMALCAFAFMSAIFWLAFYFERRTWNGGICSAHGQPWQAFDTDSSGARLYKCTSADQNCGCAASYPVDDEQPIKGMFKLTGLILVGSVVASTWAYFFALSCQH